MTYDWNKMVEITVPDGINGWVYAGSVTINGVTVDFPIGIPTSVPEPVAELLKMFIALEEDRNKVPEQGDGGGGTGLPPDDKHIECTLDGDKVSFSIPATDVYAIGTDLKHYDVSLVSLTSSDVYKLVAVRSNSSYSIMCEFSCTKTIGNGVYVYYKAVVVYNSGHCTLQSSYDRVVAVQPLPNYPPSDDTEYYLSVRNGTLAFVEPPEMGGGGGSDGSIPMVMANDMGGQIVQEDVVPLPDLLEQYGDYGLFTLRVVLADVATMMALLYSVYKVDTNTMTLYLSNAEGKRIQMTADGVIAYQTE